MEIIFIGCLVGGFLGLATLAGIKKKWGNMAYWIFVGVSFGLWELFQKMFTGHTISQTHAIMAQDSAWIGIANTVFILMLFVGLIIHLGWDYGIKKIIQKKK